MGSDDEHSFVFILSLIASRSVTIPQLQPFILRVKAGNFGKNLPWVVNLEENIFKLYLLVCQRMFRCWHWVLWYILSVCVRESTSTASLVLQLAMFCACKNVTYLLCVINKINVKQKQKTMFTVLHSITDTFVDVWSFLSESWGEKKNVFRIEVK